MSQAEHPARRTRNGDAAPPTAQYLARLYRQGISNVQPAMLLLVLANRPAEKLPVEEIIAPLEGPAKARDLRTRQRYHANLETLCDRKWVRRKRQAIPGQPGPGSYFYTITARGLRLAETAI